MSLKWPFALLILFWPLGVLLYRRRKPAKQRRQFVAETTLASKLPSYTKRGKRAKRLRQVEYGLLAIMFMLLTLLVARPQRSILKIDEEKSRDIVMCMDASGSMKDYIPNAVTNMGSIADRNRTDRFSLVVFQNTAFTVLPLTRDTVAIKDRVKFLSDGFSSNEAFNAVQDLGYDSNLQGGTDVGNGLIGCVKRFDNLNKDKSRNLILLSDMEHNGSTDYLEVAQLIPKYKIKSYILAPDYVAEDIRTGDYAAITGSSVGELGDANSVNRLLDGIFRQIFNTEQNETFVQADNPQPYIAALIVVALVYALISSRRWGSL